MDTIKNSLALYMIAVTTTRKWQELTQAGIIVDSLAKLAAIDFAGLISG